MKMVEIPLKCRECGNEIKWYHDGFTMQSVQIVCKCGNRIEWNFSPPLTGNYRGFGMKASASVPAALPALNACNCNEDHGACMWKCPQHGTRGRLA